MLRHAALRESAQASSGGLDAEHSRTASAAAQDRPLETFGRCIKNAAESCQSMPKCELGVFCILRGFVVKDRHHFRGLGCNTWFRESKQSIRSPIQAVLIKPWSDCSWIGSIPGTCRLSKAIYTHAFLLQPETYVRAFEDACHALSTAQLHDRILATISISFGNGGSFMP